MPEPEPFASAEEDKRRRIEHERFFELMPDLLAVLGPDGLLRRVNGSWERVLGWTPAELLGRRNDWLLHPEDVPQVNAGRQAMMAGEGHFNQEVRLRTRSGAWRFIKWTALSVPSEQGFYLLGRDVTEDRRAEADLRASEQTKSDLEAQLRQAQRMEAVGSLAGGIAHDFNNLLSVILSYSSMLVDDLPPGARVREDLLQIRAAGERAAALTRQLLAFSRRQILQPRVLDLNEIVAGLASMLRRLIGETIDFATFPAAAPAMVNVDPAQMEQVIVNLAVNARDAMPRGGKLTVELQEVMLDAAYRAGHPDVAPGRYILLAVSDTGTGMDEATQARVFEPFFTTKEVGKGTGLGLSTVFGIVRQSGGHVWVYSEPGCGSTFKIYLPAAAEQPAEAPPQAEPVVDLRGAETVLLVEDEEQVRKLAHAILSRAGYTVIEAANGDEAMRFGVLAPRVDLLLTDMVMPRVSGATLAAQLATQRPGLRVVFMSGYTDTSAGEQGLPPAAIFVQKPFTPEALLRKIRQALAETPRAPAPKPAQPRVMLVDDQVVMLRLLARALSQYDLTQFSDPGEALAKVRGGERFDAIVCDVYMPGMTGPAFQEQLRKIDLDQARRMLFLTGALLGSELADFLQFNLGRVLHKPIDLEALRRAVASVLAKG